jgi:hypothetical protein
MLRSGIVMLFTVCAFSALADDKIDPRDPSIWIEKIETPAHQDVPCDKFSSSVCPAYEDEKSDVQRERERREERRFRADFEPR